MSSDSKGPSRTRVFFDVNHGHEPLGRLVIELFNDKAPKTCENFLALCSSSHQGLTYKRSRFHRIIDEFMVQGGDITKGDGTGGDSIFGGEFADENLGWRKLDAKGLLCMANRGKDTNSSQFFVTLVPVPHLDGKHTIFGRLVSGEDALDRMAQVEVDSKDKPLTDVIISNCGELERRKKEPTTTAEASNNRSKQLENQSVSSERGRGKRRRSEESSEHSVSSRNGKHRKHAHRHSRSPVGEAIPTNRRHRRRSDNSIDETFRGRPRRRSGDRMRASSPIAEDEDLPMSDDRPVSPRHDHDRQRSRSPSRHRKGDSSHSTGYRRRRSLPNHYERRQRASRYEESNSARGYEHAGGDKGSSRDVRRDDRDERESGRQDEDGRLGRAPERDDVGYYEGDDAVASGGSGIKFKGRGSMKYRERNKQ